MIRGGRKRSDPLTLFSKTLCSKTNHPTSACEHRKKSRIKVEQNTDIDKRYVKSKSTGSTTFFIADLRQGRDNCVHLYQSSLHTAK